MEGMGGREASDWNGWERDMETITLIGLAAVGLAAGGISGLVGIGGGVLVVPALVLFFGFDQHSAQGTSLAMLLPPIGILAVLEYHRGGYVDLRAALIMAALFIAGTLIGSRLAVGMNEELLRRVFAGFLFVAAIRMFIG